MNNSPGKPALQRPSYYRRIDAVGLPLFLRWTNRKTANHRANATVAFVTEPFASPIYTILTAVAEALVSALTWISQVVYLTVISHHSGGVSMKRIRIFLGLGLLALVITLAACGQETGLPGAPLEAPSAATAAPAPTATMVPAAPPPAATPLPTPTPELTVPATRPAGTEMATATPIAVDKPAPTETPALTLDLTITSPPVTSPALPPQPFLLLVTEPQDRSVVYEETIRLAGRTGLQAVASVNGEAAEVNEQGIFSTKVKLEPGPNFIDVVATNNDGQVLSAVVSVIYRP